MKNITLIIVFALLALDTFAESLADKTGEQRSLYNAVCILNNITPGSIGMTEGRKLMSKYAKSIGLNYELYEFNGGNNLYILHYDATTTQEEVSEVKEGVTSINSTTTEFIPFVREVTIESNTQNNKVEQTGLVNNKSALNTELNNVQPVVANHITNDVVKFIPVKLVSAKSEFTCDCRDKNTEELNKYYTDLLKMRRTATGLLKDKLNACSYQLRKYKKVVERDERLENKKDSVEIEEDVTFEQILPDFNIPTAHLVSDKPVKTKSKKRRVRKLGRGYSRTKNTGFWAMLFPFANC